MQFTIKERLTRFLLWSQKYTQIDMLYVARGSFWTLFSQAVNSILSLVLVIAFANLLSKETYGIYRYILSIASVLNICTLTGMGTAISRITAQGGEVFRATVRYQLKWNMLMFGAFAILSGYYFVHNDSVLSISYLILGICIPASIAFNTYGSYLEGKKEFKALNLYRSLSTLVYTLGTLAVLLFGGEVIALISIYAITTFGSALFVYWHTLRTFPQTQTDDPSETIKYAKELTFLKFFDPIVSQIDKIILAHFWGPAQLAVYSLASAIPNRVTLLIKSWVAIGFPKFVEKTPAEINHVYFKRLLQGAGIGMIASLVYIALAPVLFTYLLPQYIEGVMYSQLLSLGFIFALPNRYSSMLFASQGMTRMLFTRTIIQSIIMVLLYILLGIWGGLLGLIIANLLNGLLGIIINVTLWVRVTGKA